MINLVDTPGHSDFSEDTYRVLSAVDSAVMLVDAGKGLEPQTLKLFKVCALRGIPVMTVINKWDRPGLSALELMDLIQAKIGLRPTPLTWPVGEAGDFRGVLDRRTGEFVKYTRTAGGATRAPERRMSSDEVEEADAHLWAEAVEEHELLTLDEADHDQERFLAGRRRRSCSPRRCRTSASPSCSTCCSTSPPTPARPRASTVRCATYATSSARSSSRCSPG